MYFFGALMIISLERTNLLLSKRVYTNSQGNPSSLNAANSMGGSGQFVWDLSFASNVLTLLDPESTKDVLKFVMKNSVFYENISKPFLTPQSWDAYSLYSWPQSTPYMYDYMTTFVFISTYIRITNDTNFLDEYIVNNITVKDYLIKLANVYKLYPKINGTNITDYGGNIRCFLEVIPTYLHAIPALNYGNAYMQLSISQLINDTNYLKEGINIINNANQYMYNHDGTFNCLYPNGTIQNVRTIADYTYISQYLGILIQREGGGIQNSTLNNQINTILYEMNNFAMDELYVNNATWFRALSTKDPIYDPNNLFIKRPDWGTGGSYPGSDGMIIESLAVGDDNYNRSIQFFSDSEIVISKGAMSQGIVVSTPHQWLNGTQAAIDMNYNMYRPPPKEPYPPGWPVYVDEDGTYWPEAERDLANVAAAFPEAMIRTLFGFNPKWFAWNQAANINDVFMNINKSRNFKGYLIGLKTPLGYMDIYAGENGVEIVNVTQYNFDN